MRDLSQIDDAILRLLLGRKGFLNSCVWCHNREWTLVGVSPRERLGLLTGPEGHSGVAVPIHVHGLACKVCGYLQLHSSEAFERFLDWLETDQPAHG